MLAKRRFDHRVVGLEIWMNEIFKTRKASYLNSDVERSSMGRKNGKEKYFDSH